MCSQSAVQRGAESGEESSNTDVYTKHLEQECFHCSAGGALENRCVAYIGSDWQYFCFIMGSLESRIKHQGSKLNQWMLGC